MKRSQLAHILRSACRITGDPEILVIGSQSMILGKYSHVALPEQAWMSIKADISFFNDPDEAKADMIDGAIGEASPFHDSLASTGKASRWRRLPWRTDGRLVSSRSTTAM